VEHLIVVATTLAVATFVTGLLLPVLARRDPRRRRHGARRRAGRLTALTACSVPARQ
jgi:hypothetical protein